LTGEGGDELFAGYPKYAVDPFARRLARLPAPLRDSLLGGGADRLPFRFRRLQVVARSARFRDESERMASWFAGLAGNERARLLSPALRAEEPLAAAAFRKALDESAARRPLDRMLDVDLRLWLPDDLLMKVDKMSMAASIEARVPLLDHPLIEWAARLPDRFKVRGLSGKVLLKRLARHLVPPEVVDRRKVGFTVPLAPWFRGPLRALLRDTLLSPACLARRPGANFGLLTGWKRLTEGTYGCPARYWIASDENGVRGVLPLFLKRGPLGRTLFSPPGGLLADDEATAEALLEPARETVRRERLDYLELRDQLHRWPGLATSDEHAT